MRSSVLAIATIGWSLPIALTAAEPTERPAHSARAAETNAGDAAAAAGLEARAREYERLAVLYDVRATGGSKQEASFRSTAQHYARLARASRQAAQEMHAGDSNYSQ